MRTVVPSLPHLPLLAFADDDIYFFSRGSVLTFAQYNIFSEAMGDRGRWDTARVVTIMLAAFHVSVWGLELSLDLAIRTDGPVDLMNRPPPVVSSGNPDAVGSGFDWIVQVILLRSSS